MKPSHAYKVCKVCNTPYKVCNNHATTMQKACLLHTCYTLVTGFTDRLHTLQAFQARSRYYFLGVI